MAKTLTKTELPQNPFRTSLQDFAQSLNVSLSTAKRLRDRELIEGVHWVKVGGLVRLHTELVTDWIVNLGDPMAHSQAIAAYLDRLSKNQRR